jgi:hypothetical protein
MLLTGSRRATYVPLLYFGAGGVITAAAVPTLGATTKDARLGVSMLLLLGVMSLFFAVGSSRRLAVSGDALLVRGFGKTRSLELGACAFGVRLKTGRSPTYVVFVTDGVASEDIGEWIRERGARAAVTRLETLFVQAEPPLVGGPPPRNRRLERARRQAARVESEWKSQVAVAEKAVAEYYRSRTWRFTKYAIPVALVLYVLGASLYFYLTGS